MAGEENILSTEKRLQTDSDYKNHTLRSSDVKFCG